MGGSQVSIQCWVMVPCNPGAHPNRRDRKDATASVLSACLALRFGLDVLLGSAAGDDVLAAGCAASLVTEGDGES
jgi:hypothetical protein